MKKGRPSKKEIERTFREVSSSKEAAHAFLTSIGVSITKKGKVKVRGI